MELLFLLLLVPVIWPLCAKFFLNKTITYQEMLLNIFIIIGIICILWYIGIYNSIKDFEILNGYITSKERIHGTYTTSYSCNCTSSTDSKGNTTTKCDTCYRTYYTVSWKIRTSVGDVEIDYASSLSKNIYNTPDPVIFKNCKPCDPASMEHSYKNYIKNSSKSLYNNKNINNPYDDVVPEYPRVYNFYEFDRVLEVGSKIPSNIHDNLNSKLNKALTSIGSNKQVNIIIIFTAIGDPKFKHAVENKWMGGKKNDVIIFIGTDNNNNIIWVDVMTWALNYGNELFIVKLRDDIKNMSVLDSDILSTNIIENIVQYYDRPLMKEYEYLKNSIKPPVYILVILSIISITFPILVSILFHSIEFDMFNINKYNRKIR